MADFWPKYHANSPLNLQAQPKGHIVLETPQTLMELQAEEREIFGALTVQEVLGGAGNLRLDWVKPVQAITKEVSLLS